MLVIKTISEKPSQENCESCPGRCQSTLTQRHQNKSVLVLETIFAAHPTLLW